MTCLTAPTLARTPEHGVMVWLIAGYKSVNRAAIFRVWPGLGAVNGALPPPYLHRVGAAGSP